MYTDYVKDGWDRINLIEGLVDKYRIKSALYPGSYIHITPSFIIPKVVYVDLDKKAKKFFSENEVYTYINKVKMYEEEAIIEFYAADYGKAFLKENQLFDLLISQYAGFVSQSCKRYLKHGGILVANNSHGDAGVAYHDQDFQLIAVANNRKGKWTISEKNLDDYFIPKKDIEVTKEYLLTLNRGLGYKKSAGVYIFIKRIYL